MTNGGTKKQTRSGLRFHLHWTASNGPSSKRPQGPEQGRRGWCRALVQTTMRQSAGDANPRGSGNYVRGPRPKHRALRAAIPISAWQLHPLYHGQIGAGTRQGLFIRRLAHTALWALRMRPATVASRQPLSTGR